MGAEQVSLANTMAVGTARVFNNQLSPQNSIMTNKLPSVAISPQMGAHLADSTSRAAVISERNRNMFG